MNPFLTVEQFQAMFDGPKLSPAQTAQVTLLLQVASNWIINQKPGIQQTGAGGTPVGDPAAVLVTYEVVANAVRYQKYAPLSSFTKTTGHRTDGGALDNPTKALDFTDRHKVLLGIPLRSVPLSSCVPSDFKADDAHAGWTTEWSEQSESAWYG